jgi:hypothetical protein
MEQHNFVLYKHKPKGRSFEKVTKNIFMTKIMSVNRFLLFEPLCSVQKTFLFNEMMKQWFGCELT